MLGHPFILNPMFISTSRVFHEQHAMDKPSAFIQHVSPKKSDTPMLHKIGAQTQPPNHINLSKNPTTQTTFTTSYAFPFFSQLHVSFDTPPLRMWPSFIVYKGTDPLPWPRIFTTPDFGSPLVYAKQICREKN